LYYTASGNTIKCENSSEIFTYQEEITSFAFSPEGFIIAFESFRIFKSPDLQEIENNLLISLLGKVNSISVQDKMIAAAGHQENIQVIVENMEKSLRINRGSIIHSVVISPNKKHVAAFADDGRLYFFSDLELKKSDQIRISRRVSEETLERFIFEFSPDSSRLGLSGDIHVNLMMSSSAEFKKTNLVKKSNISILRWPKLDMTITACVDNVITVNDMINENELRIFTPTAQVWDFLFYDEKIVVAAGQQVEVFKDVRLEIPQDEDESQKSEKVEKNPEKELFDRTIGVYPQDPVVPVNDDKSFSILFRSTLGTVMSREFNSGITRLSRIEIEFDDASFHSHVSIPNHHEFVLAFMNENGIFLASQSQDVGLEDFVDDAKPSVIYFQGFRFEVNWSLQMPAQEVPESICICNVCVVFTSLNYLRVFNFGGVQLQVLSMTGPVVSLASHQNTLAVLYHSGAPVLGCQSILCEFWYMSEFSLKSDADFFKEDIKLALSPESNLIWSGFSETGNFFTVDSSNTVRNYWKRGSSWVPVCILEDFTRIVGVTDSSVLINPKESSQLIEEVPFEVPLCRSKVNDYEQKMIQESLKLDNNRQEIDKKKKLMELDKGTFERYMNLIDEGEPELAFGLALSTFQEKTGLLCVKYGQGVKAFTIVSNLAKHFGINLPSRLARPVRNEVDFVEKNEVKEEQAPRKEESKENEPAKEELPRNPFQKSSGASKDLFESLSSNSKRKPESSQLGKKMKK
jgi:hypothetical protein